MPHTIQTPTAADADADATVNADPNTTTQTEQTEETATMTDTTTTEPQAAEQESAGNDAGAEQVDGQGDDDDADEPDPRAAVLQAAKARLEARDKARAEQEAAARAEREACARAEREAAIDEVLPAYIADVIAGLEEEHECKIQNDGVSVTLPIAVLLALTNNDDLRARIAVDLGIAPPESDDDAAEESKPARKAGKRKASKRASKPAAAATAAKPDRQTIEAALIEIVESAGPDGIKVSEVMPLLAKRRLDSYSKGRVGVLLRELVDADKIAMTGNPPAGARYVKKAGKRSKLAAV